MRAKKKIVQLADNRVVAIDNNVETVRGKLPVMIMEYAKGSNGYQEKDGGGILISEEKLAGARVIGFID